MYAVILLTPVLAKTEELGLEETIKVIEAKETGRRSTAQLGPGGLANPGVNKITAYKRDQRNDAITRPSALLLIKLVPGVTRSDISL